MNNNQSDCSFIVGSFYKNGITGNAIKVISRTDKTITFLLFYSEGHNNWIPYNRTDTKTIIRKRKTGIEYINHHLGPFASDNNVFLHHLIP